MTNIELIKKWHDEHPGKKCRFKAGGECAEYGVQEVIEWPKWGKASYPDDPLGKVRHATGEHTFLQVFDWDAQANSPDGITILDDKQPTDDIDWQLIEDSLNSQLAVLRDRMGAVELEIGKIRERRIQQAKD